MKTRIITALLIILCVVPPLVYGGWLIDLLIAFIIVAGGIELLNLKEQDAKWPLGIKTLAIVAVFVLVLSDERLHVALLGVSALIFLSIPVFTDRFHAKDGFLCIAYVTFFFAIARCFLHIYGTNRMYVWFIIIATYACDTAAYFCGRFLGKQCTYFSKKDMGGLHWRVAFRRSVILCLCLVYDRYDDAASDDDCFRNSDGDRTDW